MANSGDIPNNIPLLALQAIRRNATDTGFEAFTPSGGVTSANPTASVGLTIVNGAAGTFMRSDAAPALDVGINPTWSGNHIFSNQIKVAATSNQIVLQSAGVTGTLTWAPTSTNKTITFPDLTGTLPIGTGTAGRITEWVTNANTLQASTLIKTGAGVLTLDANQTGQISINNLNGHTPAFSFFGATGDHTYGFQDQDGPIPLGAGSSTVTSTNSYTGANHTHAVTSSSNPGAAASLLATENASGNLTIAGIFTGSNTTDSSSTTTGGIVASGGIGAAKNLVIPTTSGTTGYGLKFDSGANGLIAAFQALDAGGVSSLFYNTNRYYDGTNWQQFNTRAGGALLISDDTIAFYAFATSSSTPAPKFSVTNAGVTTIAGGLIVGGTTTGATSSTSFTNVTSATTTNAYAVKGGQAASTANTGWIKIFIGTNAAWIPYWQNATP